MPFIQIHDREVHVIDEGDREAPPIVFLHALGASSDMWREQIAALSPGYRCLAVDLAGHGKSAPCDGQASIEQFADDIADVLAAMDVTRAHIVGASLGGMIAQAFAIRHPDRVDHTMLVGTTAKMPDAGPWIERAAKVRREGVAGLAGGTMERWFTAQFREHGASRIAETRAIFEGTVPESYARACEAIAGMDLRAGLPSIESPVLVIAGEDDPATTPAMAQDIRSAINDATLILLPQVAHMMAIEKAASVARWIGAFLPPPQI